MSIVFGDLQAYLLLPRVPRGTTRDLPIDTGNTYTFFQGGGAGFGFDHNGPTIDAGEPKNSPPNQAFSVNTSWYVHNAAYHCVAAQSNPADPGQIPGDNGWDALTVISGTVETEFRTQLRVSVPANAIPGTYVAYRNTNIGGGSNTFTYYWIVFEVLEAPDPPATPTLIATPMLLANAPAIQLTIS